MHSPQIQKLINSVSEKFGNIEYYGSSPNEEHGVCFTVQEIEATFSVSTIDGTLKDSYDIQIEGVPPGEYLYTGEVSLQKFIELVSKFTKPESEWP